eukprot:9150632-Pyramimonas_sp.AAC.1
MGPDEDRELRELHDVGEGVARRAVEGEEGHLRGAPQTGPGVEDAGDRGDSNTGAGHQGPRAEESQRGG